MKKIILIPAILTLIGTSSFASDMNIKKEEISQPVSISLSDIKEALYDLLEDTKKNKEQIDNATDNLENFQKEDCLRNKKINYKISKNVNNIQKINIVLDSQDKAIHKLEQKTLLYVGKIKAYVEKNKRYLPVDKK